ncbi:CPXCG motif-containing cysteine-rich protein [Wenzhouxiangella limi]|uniref:CPXCG motif-containing cysteine-rich protein n=1 Tax=Wenzhouxiangella limi TaxID=2707351 RepID=UPI0019439618|nr:CPXCG motif-containing cysteine-rich protein [Wenzhouxiangella limi]
MLTESEPFSCPWCGEPNWVELEPDDAGQTVLQDCAVCCRPIEIDLPGPDSADRTLHVRAEGD